MRLVDAVAIVAVLCAAAIFLRAAATAPTVPQAITHPPHPTLVADDLANPRGVAVLPSGDLIVAEAGTGEHGGPGLRSGRLLRLEDRDGDGRWLGREERRVLLAGQVSYNGRSVFGTGRDEVGGLGDVALGPDGFVLFTKDDPFEGYAPDGAHNDIAVAMIPAAGGEAAILARRRATLNALVWDEERGEVYVAESGAERLIAATLQGRTRVVARFGTLAQGQQAVPAGMARDPRTGDLYVALFSGVVYDRPRAGDRASFVPGAAKVVRVDPEAGTVHDVVTGLTTAVDVAVAPNGTLYVLEMTSGPPTARLPETLDLHDPDAPPHPGGYARFAGRVIAVEPDGSRRLLAAGLDAPTNLTLAEDTLYISTGQGTPGRAVPGPDGTQRIRGRIWRLTLP